MGRQPAPIAMELRKGRRDLLRRVLEAAERLEHIPVTMPRPSLLPLLRSLYQPHRP